jgi:F-type H+-transporting ATPase subunit b
LKHSTQFARNSPLILSIFLFAAMVLAIGSSPVPVAAQQATPAAQSAPGGEAAVEKTVDKAGASESSEEDTSIYRHTPLVTSLAKMFHLSVETTARLFEFINFAIVALAILIPLVRIMPRVIRKRSETLKYELETARKTTADANARLSAVEAKLSKLDSEITAIRAQVEVESKQDEQRIKASIGEESGRIVAAAEQEISVAVAQAKRGLRHFAADLAIEQAAKQLVLTPETDRALIAEFVGDAAKRGQN